MNKKQYQSICKRITERILGFLEQGIVPWQKPWNGGKANAPRSVSTKKVYRGTNLAILGCAGYESPWWLTFGQAKKLGGQVRKGEKSFPIHYWKFHPAQDCKTCLGGQPLCEHCGGSGKYQPFPSLFSFNVFSANQCDGLPEKYYPAIKDDDEVRDFTPVEACDEIIANYPDSPKVYHDQADSCHYRPSADEVHMVKPEKFISDEEYYSTFFHELVHSTGHKKRLAREGVTGLNFFGSHEYSKEELVAELGSTFLCAIAGIDRSEVIQNSASYISGWKSKLSDNEDWIVWAGSRSAKACDHILGTEYEGK